LRILIIYKGWYNLKRGRFNKFENFGLVSMFTSKKIENLSVFDSDLTDIPTSLVHKSFILNLIDATDLDMMTIFKEYVFNFLRTEISLSENDEILFDSWITYSMLLFNSKPLFQKLAYKYKVNLSFD
jgi:hypothetical protein